MSGSRPGRWSLLGMIVCGLAAAAWPGASSAQSAAIPEMKPGIPGLKMVDVRDHKYLWREIDELHQWERGQRITVTEFRDKAIEKTAHYLGLSGNEAESFATIAGKAIQTLRDSFAESRRAEQTDGQAHFDRGLETAAAQVTSVLGEQPRHQLFAPDVKRWLLRLAFGPQERKEAAEAKKTAPAGEP